tara:strand:+ start:365 stop:1459 length:1095 start_codon:yes stop_codon:yes gene_type:complete
MDNKYLIVDTRDIDDYNKLSFSGYKKNDVLNVLLKSIETKKIENTCNWVTECICSGYIELCWEKMLLYASDVISINNPSLPNYLYKKNILFYNIYNNIDKKKEKNEIIELRNNQIIRNLFFSISIILALSSKTKRYNKYPKIKLEDFNFNNISLRLSANVNLLPDNFIHFNEPEELKIIINEIYYHLKNKTGGYDKCIYWIIWILEWEKKIKKNKGPWNIDNRNIDVDEKYKADLIWIIWGVILLESKYRDNNIKKQVQSLFELYISNFKIGKKNKRLPYLFNSVVYLMNNYNLNIEMIPNRDIYIQCQINNNKLFELKKIYEVKPIVKKQVKIKKKKIKKTDDIDDIDDIYKNKLDLFNNLPF